MVFRHGIDVTVIDLLGNPLTEYGGQTVIKGNPGSKIVSTKIEAKTGKPFNLLIKPQNPFPFQTDEPGMKGKVFHLPTSEHWLRNKADADAQPVLAKSTEEGAEAPDAGRQLRSATKEKESAVPPFQLAAYVYMDGNSKPECRSIIYLNPNDTESYKPNGTKLMGRWETDEKKSGKSSSGAQIDTQPVRALPWVFNPYGGLDYWLEKLNVNATDPIVPSGADEIEEENLTNMFGGSTLGESKAKKGVIKVVFKRIVVEGPVQPTNQAAAYARRQGEESDAKGPADEWVTQETGVERTKAQEMSLHIMAWSKYRKSEDFYAEFEFQYMSRGKLMNMGLSQQDGTPIVTKPSQAPKDGAKTAKKRRADEDGDGVGEPDKETPKKRETSHSYGKAQKQKQTQAKPPAQKELRQSTMAYRDPPRPAATAEDADD